MIDSRVADLFYRAVERAYNVGYAFNEPVVEDNFKSCRVLGIASKGRLIKINKDLVSKGTDDQLYDTIAHELAHIIDQQTRGYSAHDRVWKRIAVALGANPSSESDIPFEMESARKVRRFVYISKNGIAKTLTSYRHNKIQRGRAWYHWTDGAVVDKTCDFREIKA